MAGSVMLAMAREYQAAIEAGAGAGAGPGAGQQLILPNATLLGPQLHNVLRFKAIWGRCAWLRGLVGRWEGVGTWW